MNLITVSNASTDYPILAGIMSNYNYLLGALFVLFILWNVVTLKKIDNTDDNSENAKITARTFVIHFLVLTGLWIWSLTTLIQ